MADGGGPAPAMGVDSDEELTPGSLSTLIGEQIWVEGCKPNFKLELAPGGDGTLPTKILILVGDKLPSKFSDPEYAAKRVASAIGYTGPHVGYRYAVVRNKEDMRRSLDNFFKQTETIPSSRHVAYFGHGVFNKSYYGFLPGGIMYNTMECARETIFTLKEFGELALKHQLAEVHLFTLSCGSLATDCTLQGHNNSISFKRLSLCKFYTRAAGIEVSINDHDGKEWRLIPPSFNMAPTFALAAFDLYDDKASLWSTDTDHINVLYPTLVESELGCSSDFSRLHKAVAAAKEDDDALLGPEWGLKNATKLFGETFQIAVLNVLVPGLVGRFCRNENAGITVEQYNFWTHASTHGFCFRSMFEGDPGVQNKLKSLASKFQAEQTYGCHLANDILCENLPPDSDVDRLWEEFHAYFKHAWLSALLLGESEPPFVLSDTRSTSKAVMINVRRKADSPERDTPDELLKHWLKDAESKKVIVIVVGQTHINGIVQKMKSLKLPVIIDATNLDQEDTVPTSCDENLTKQLQELKDDVSTFLIGNGITDKFRRQFAWWAALRTRFNVEEAHGTWSGGLDPLALLGIVTHRYMKTSDEAVKFVDRIRSWHATIQLADGWSYRVFTVDKKKGTLTIEQARQL
eukprot:m.173183 g.173183  ORF g.173183 m.173183 type:complete len:632 (-) comp13655_c0_seq1:72-1967(-)